MGGRVHVLRKLVSWSGHGQSLVAIRKEVPAMIGHADRLSPWVVELEWAEGRLSVLGV